MTTREPAEADIGVEHDGRRPRRLGAALRVIVDLVRGGIVGVTEIIPGVSGGTVALIIGVYDTLIDGAGHLARAAARVVTDGFRGRGFGRAGAHVRAVRWSVVLPVGVGMLIAIFVGARLLSPVIEQNPVQTRALFAGLILASLIVPARMAGRRWRWHEVLVAAIAAIALFVVLSLPTTTVAAQPALPLVALAAAVAVCALVLPGVSGSYLLLTLGLYAPTLAALNDFDLPFIGAFVLGGVVGLGLFVPVLQWLLSRHRRITLVIMTGLMAGSLRAVWPWQTDDNRLLAPQDEWPASILLFAIGAAVVLSLLAIEAALLRRHLMSAPRAPEPDAAAAIDEKEHQQELDAAADEPGGHQRG